MTSQVAYRHSGAIFSTLPAVENNPYGLPDWRDESTYPRAGDLEPAQWRWEFVRRSSEYRKSWSLHQRLFEKGYECEGETFYWLGQQFKLKYVIDPRTPSSALDPALLVYDAGFMHWMGLEGEHYDHDKLMQEQEDDAFKAVMDECCDEEEQSETIKRHGLALRYFLEEAEGNTLLAINPFLPLKPQFEAASRLIARRLAELKPYLSDVKVVTGRQHPEKYRDYLRILDARDKTSPFAASWSVIQKTFEKERHGILVRSVYTQAVSTQTMMIKTGIFG